jgi:hypothetical protein
MKKILFILVIFTLAGCSEETVMHTTRVISDPLGARIELNDNYLGVTPLEFQWEVYADSNILVDDYELRALPISPGHYVQTKLLWGFIGNDVAPETIFFDMRLGPVLPPPIDVRIDDSF